MPKSSTYISINLMHPAAGQHPSPRRLELTWHEGSRRWSKVIGKRLNVGQDRLVQAQWYFGPNYDTSLQLAKARKAEWTALKRTWRRDHQPYLTALLEPFADTPHWYSKAHGSGVTVEHVQTVQAELDTPDQDEVAEMHAETTVAECAVLYLAHRRDREGTDFKSTSNKSFEIDLKGGLREIDNTLTMAGLKAHHVDQMRVRILKAANSPRTARNYCVAVKMMLEWYYGSEFFYGGSEPKGLRAVYKKFPKLKAARPKHLPLATLKTVIAKATEQRRLYLMLMLNTGMQPTDIAAVLAKDIDLDAGVVKWIRRKNDRLLSENDYEVESHLWPETAWLVKRQAAKTGLAFRTHDGKPLYHETGSRNRQNAVTKSLGKYFKRLYERFEIDVSAKNMRQTGAQMVYAEGGNYELSRVWLGREFRQEDKPYLAKLIKELNQVTDRIGDRLRAEGIFP